MLTRSRAILMTLALCIGCSGTPQTPSTQTRSTNDVARYRLKLRNNSVDPGEAFRCYGSCQAQRSPKGYFDCLSKCPGFEVTLGEYCAKDEVPPVAACLTVRKVPASKEVPAGLIVLAIVGTFALVVGAATLCTSSPTQCGYAQYPW